MSKIPITKEEITAYIDRIKNCNTPEEADLIKTELEEMDINNPDGVKFILQVLSDSDCMIKISEINGNKIDSSEAEKLRSSAEQLKNFIDENPLN